MRKKMRQSDRFRGHSIRLTAYVWAAMAAWTAVVGLMLLWSLVRQGRETLEVARIEARSAFNKDQVYRQWCARQGGVYVPESQQTPANPYLSGVEERDITTPSGRRLTLVNPAYMTRQVHEMGAGLYGLLGHITSLNPIRPENAPDPWEAQALAAFEKGAGEVSSLESINEKDYLRLMKPLVTETGCLQCHSEQGYKVGDVRGGISVSVPMAPLRATAREHAAALVMGHGLMWLMGTAGIFFGGQHLSRRIQEGRQAQKEIAALAKFPDENPNPVLRVSVEGVILYCNRGAEPLMDAWGVRINDCIPYKWYDIVLDAAASRQTRQGLVQCLSRTYSLTFAPVLNFYYVNIYALDITERKAAEEDLKQYQQHLQELVRQGTEEVTRTNTQLLAEIDDRKRLQRQILEISEKEQMRIGQELHDSLGQQLVGIAFMSKVLQQNLKDKAPEEANSAAEIAKLVNHAIDQTRGLAKGLHPIDLHSGGLDAAIEELVATARILFGIDCVYTCGGSVTIHDATVATHLYRIIQEAITNAVKHGNAKKIYIELTSRTPETELKIKNDGYDFPARRPEKTGIGLKIMKYRVEMIQGRLDIRRPDEGGTAVVVVFPEENGDNKADSDGEQS